jgi:glycosyltransferase involved in cell wall biosynthesis
MKLEFAVIHMGPRLHYAVPEVIAQAGMLKALYTDAHAGTPSVRLASLVPPALRPRALRRLLARDLPAAIPPARVKSWLFPTLQQERFNRAYPDRRKQAWFAAERNVGGHWLGRKAIADNFGGANALYIHPCACTEAIREAKRRGLFVVLEAISHPFNMRTQKAEYERLGLPLTEGMDCIEENIRFFAEEAALADVVLAASEYVKRGLVELGIPPERIAVVPYGLDAGFYSESPQPQPGRVLYVGTVDSHKGIAYLAQAARQLQAEGFAAEFIAVGPSSSAGLLQHPAFAGLNYVGQVPRSEVKHRFASADLFVFPTLTDGFGMVLLEALFAGLPIVCTPNCGDVVRDGFNGRVVPTHDAAALAAAIREIVDDRDLRARMSRHALARKPEFTLETYQRHLIEAVREHAARRGN